MLPKLLMITGAALFLLGFIGVFNLMIDPIKTMFKVVFKRKDDYVFYESDKGKNLLERQKKNLLTASIFFIVVGGVLFGMGYYLKYGPRGYNGISANENLTESPVDETSELHVQGLDKEGKYHDKDGKVYSSYIEVTGQEIKHDGQLIGDIQAFEYYINDNKIDRNTMIYLIDNFAASSTYHRVDELLIEKAIPHNKD